MKEEGIQIIHHEIGKRQIPKGGSLRVFLVFRAGTYSN